MGRIEVRIIEGFNKRSGAIYAALEKGEFCVIGGVWDAASVSGLNMGQAEVGMRRLVLSTGGVQNKPGKVFPIDKQIYPHENGDVSYETLTSGDQVIYYAGSHVRLALNTYDGAVISGGTALGTDLYVNSTGWLGLSGGAAAAGAMSPIATLVGHEAVGTTKFFDGTALYNRDLIVIELL